MGKQEKNSNIFSDAIIKMYIMMLKIRKTEEKLVELYPQQEMRCPTHFHIGQEAVSVGICTNLKKEDYLFCSHRSHGPYIAKGGDLKSLIAELYGKITGCCRGKAGSQHLMAPEVNFLGASAIVGGTIPMAVGAALAIVMRNENRVSVVFFGDGGVEEGVFHESLNFASLKKLPVLFICENNFYSTQSPLSVRQPFDNIYKRSQIYGISGIRVDGNDVQAVFKVAKQAVESARKGKGPILIECRTYRWLEHVGPYYDFNLGYRTKKELDKWMKRCPIKSLEKYLVTQGILSESKISNILRQLDREINTAVAFAKESTFPDKSELVKDVYFERR